MRQLLRFVPTNPSARKIIWGQFIRERELVAQPVGYSYQVQRMDKSLAQFSAKIPLKDGEPESWKKK
jgi:hypothetical protein